MDNTQVAAKSSLITHAARMGCGKGAVNIAGSIANIRSETFSRPGFLVHGWDRIKNLNFYSLLALSTHKNVKCYPSMTKVQCLGLIDSGMRCAK